MKAGGQQGTLPTFAHHTPTNIEQLEPCTRSTIIARFSSRSGIASPIKTLTLLLVAKTEKGGDACPYRSAAMEKSVLNGLWSMASHSIFLASYYALCHFKGAKKRLPAHCRV
jgi:hypothetical protein